MYIQFCNHYDCIILLIVFILFVFICFVYVFLLCEMWNMKINSNKKKIKFIFQEPEKNVHTSWLKKKRIGKKGGGGKGTTCRHYCRCWQIWTRDLMVESLWSYPLSHNSSLSVSNHEGPWSNCRNNPPPPKKKKKKKISAEEQKTFSDRSTNHKLTLIRNSSHLYLPHWSCVTYHQ